METGLEIMGGEIERKIRNKLIKFRSIDYIIHTENFKIVWKNITEAERKELTVYILGGKVRYLKTYIKDKLRLVKGKDFNILSVNKLRRCIAYFNKMFPQNKILNYESLNKESLIIEITNAVQKVKANSTRIINQSQASQRTS